MHSFLFRVPPTIDFGWGRRDCVGEAMVQFGSRCLIVTSRRFYYESPIIREIQDRLAANHVDSAVFHEVIPNPTVDVMDRGAVIARDFAATVVLGVGGGSAMDSAKAIALGATHPGSVWDYRLFGERSIVNSVVPIVTLGTTAGTGSHISPVSVLTHSGLQSKFAIVDDRLCPKWAIVDPALTVSVPPRVTAATGFDVLAHAFESMLHPQRSPFGDLCAGHALQLVRDYLPRAVRDGQDVVARDALAQADTLAGICITNAGTTLPHGIAMAIGGHFPSVMHGEALASVYPQVMRFTWKHAVPQFSRLYRIMSGGETLPEGEDEEAARSCESVEKFLMELGLPVNMAGLTMDQARLEAVATDTFKLPDFQANPRIPTLSDVYTILEASLTEKRGQPSRRGHYSGTGDHSTR